MGILYRLWRKTRRASKRHSKIFEKIIFYNCRNAFNSKSLGVDLNVAFIESISGDTPKSGKVILKSVDTAGDRQAIHLHLLEPTPTVVAYATLLQRGLRNATLTVTVDPCLLARHLPNRQVYYAASRFLLAPYLLRNGVEQLLIVDVDCLMKNGPWEKFAPFSNKVGFIFRENQKSDCRGVLASTVYYDNNAAAIDYADLNARAIAKTLRMLPNYHIDQIIPTYLNRIASRSKSGSPTFQIPEGVMSYDYDPKAAFWTAKGWDNKLLGRFTIEKDELLMQVLRIDLTISDNVVAH
jgi:hypothetical protein